MRKIIILSLIVCTWTAGYSQFKKLARTAEDIANAAELTAIAVDIVETTSFTLEKLETCKSELRDLETLINSPSAIRYLSDNNKRGWANDIRLVSMNVQLYSTLISNSLKRLATLQRGMLKEQAGNVIGSISDAIAGGGKASAPVVEAVGEVKSEVARATLEEQLVSFLLKVDEFNKAVDKLVLETHLLSETIGAQLGFNIMYSMPSRSIYRYAQRRNLQID